MNARHGDVPLHKIASVPKDAEKLKHEGSFTLAYGEVTGHHHTLYAAKEDMTIYKIGDTFVVDLKVDTPLRHQEHEEIIVPKGIWTVGMEEEYDPYLKRMNRVID